MFVVDDIAAILGIALPLASGLQKLNAEIRNFQRNFQAAKEEMYEFQREVRGLRYAVLHTGQVIQGLNAEAAPTRNEEKYCQYIFESVYLAKKSIRRFLRDQASYAERIILFRNWCRLKHWKAAATHVKILKWKISMSKESLQLLLGVFTLRVLNLIWNKMQDDPTKSEEEKRRHQIQMAVAIKQNNAKWREVKSLKKSYKKFPRLATVQNELASFKPIINVVQQVHKTAVAEMRTVDAQVRAYERCLSGNSQAQSIADHVTPGSSYGRPRYHRTSNSYQSANPSGTAMVSDIGEMRPGKRQAGGRRRHPTESRSSRTTNITEDSTGLGGAGTKILTSAASLSTDFVPAPYPNPGASDAEVKASSAIPPSDKLSLDGSLPPLAPVPLDETVENHRHGDESALYFHGQSHVSEGIRIFGDNNRLEWEMRANGTIASKEMN